LSGVHIFDGLNESQKKAVVTTEGPVLIVAGPGTGKTSVIVAILRSLLRFRTEEGKCRYSPERIRLAAPTGRASRKLIDSVTKGLNMPHLDDKPSRLFAEEIDQIVDIATDISQDDCINPYNVHYGIGTRVTSLLLPLVQRHPVQTSISFSDAELV